MSRSLTPLADRCAAVAAKFRGARRDYWLAVAERLRAEQALLDAVARLRNAATREAGAIDRLPRDRGAA